MSQQTRCDGLSIEAQRFTKNVRFAFWFVFYVFVFECYIKCRYKAVILPANGVYYIQSPTMYKRTYLLLSLLLTCLIAFGQKAYFVDGYHGGVYGHYPLAWYTQFIVDNLKNNPEWCIGLEIEPETWDSVKVRTPEAYANFQSVMKGSQVEYTNPTYAQPYLYNISGESILRQFSYGIKKLRSHFPDITFTTYSVEEPCFTSCLPQILKSFGFKYASLKCPDTCWGGYTAAFGGTLVNWFGADGTSLLSVPRYACEELHPTNPWQTMAWDNSRKYLKTCIQNGIIDPVGMCYQDAGWKGGPWLGYGGRTKNGSIYTLWTDYIEQVAQKTVPTDYHFSQEDVCAGLMWGSQVLQRLSQQVRRCENKMSLSERISAMAAMENGFRPDAKAMDEAWRKLLLAQHHDCWIVPYNGLNSRGTWADNVRLWTDDAVVAADSTINSALDSYGQAATNDQEGQIRVFNAASSWRHEVITAQLSSGRELTFEDWLPPFGYSTYAVKDLKNPNTTNEIKIDKNTCVLENDHYRIVFDLKQGGAISSLVNKFSGCEYVKETDGFGFAALRGYFRDNKRFRTSMESRAKATVIIDNRLLRSVRIDGEVGGVPFSQTVTLRRNSDVIDFSLTVNWRGGESVGDPVKAAKNSKHVPYYDTRYMLSVFFPTTTEAPKLRKSAPFDVCESRLEDTFFNRWDSIKHNITTGWIDLVGSNDRNLALFTDHTTSYSYGSGYPLGLTVQYSGAGLWWRGYPITEPTTIRYAIVPYNGKFEKGTIATLYEHWSLPVVARHYADVALERRSLVNTNDAKCEISAAIVDGDDVLLRLFNNSDEPISTNVETVMDSQLLSETTPDGQPLQTVNGSSGNFKVSLSRFGLRTFRLKK